jgi:uncharacterized protein (TIGR02722 family)
MKKTGIGLVCIAVFVLVSACSSGPQVKRVDADSQEDLSGYWNNKDVKIVCDDLITQCLNSQRVTQAIADKGRIPRVVVGNFKNESDEHIDTKIIASTMEISLDNSGKLQFVAGGDTRQELRAERQDQQGNASEETAAALGNETAADFLLTGSVRTVVDQAGNKSARTYYVRAELTNIETNDRLWTGQNTDISKTIVRSKSKL